MSDVPPGRFRWRWPRLVAVRAADPVTHARLNRYHVGTPYQVTIGIAAYVRGRGLSLLWKGSDYRRRAPAPRR